MKTWTLLLQARPASAAVPDLGLGGSNLVTSMPNPHAIEENAPVGVTLWELTQHVLLITGAFLIIFGVAIGLHWLIWLLISKGIIEHATPLEWALLAAKYVVLVGDFALFCALLVRRGWRAAKTF